MNKFDSTKLKCEFKNFIAIYENAFSLKECENAISLFEIYNKFGYTYSRDSSILNYKDDTSLDISPVIELDICGDFINCFHERFYKHIYPLYNIQYPILQKLRRHRVKHIKIQKTLPSQGYHTWHCELDGSLNTNDRVLSWILYLNDVKDGGETEFLYQSLRFSPKQGTFILFPAHFTHTHRGNPPLTNTKYIATGWVEFLNTTDIQGIPEISNLSENTIDKDNIKYS